MDYSLIVGERHLPRNHPEVIAALKPAAAAAASLSTSVGEDGQQQQQQQQTISSSSWGLPRLPIVSEADDDGGGETVRLLYLGVIDYLQRWTCGKACAMWVKVGKSVALSM